MFACDYITDVQAVGLERCRERDHCPREETLQLHGDIAISEQAQVVIAVAPVLDKSDIRMGLGGCCSHVVMIPLLLN